MSQSKSKSSKDAVDERKEGIGQGELYSPDHAIKVEQNKNDQEITRDEGDNSNNNNNTMMDIKNKMGMIKDRLMEKLSAASVPSDALDNARHFVETVLKDVTTAAQGLTKEAMQKIKSHLADILPSLSPSLTSKMVDDAEKEVASGEGEQHKKGEMEKTNDTLNQHKGKVYVSPASSLFSSFLAKPVMSRL